MSECSEGCRAFLSWADTHTVSKGDAQVPSMAALFWRKGAIPGCLGWISSTRCPLATCTLLQVWLCGLEEHILPPSNPTAALHQPLQCPNFILSCPSLINFLALLAAWEEPLTACLIACLLLLGTAELSSEGQRRQCRSARRRQEPHPRKGGDGLAGSNSRFPSRQGPPGGYPLPHTARPNCVPLHSSAVTAPEQRQRSKVAAA